MTGATNKPKDQPVPKVLGLQEDGVTARYWVEIENGVEVKLRFVDGNTGHELALNADEAEDVANSLAAAVRESRYASKSCGHWKGVACGCELRGYPLEAES